MRQNLFNRAANTFLALATSKPAFFSRYLSGGVFPRPALSIKGRRDGGKLCLRGDLSNFPLKPLQGAFCAFSGGLNYDTGPCAAPQARCAGRGRSVREVSQHICTILGTLGVLGAH